MARINLVMQSKGGVGKSVVAALLAQFLRDAGSGLPICIDTDPLNTTFADYAAFGAHRFELLNTTRVIDPRNFDRLFLKINDVLEDQEVVIDSGATTFIALTEYLTSGDVPAVLVNCGHEFVVHIVVTGGQGQDKTLGSLAYIVETYKNARIVVWINPYHGPLQHQGQGFRQMRIYQNNRSRLRSVVELPDMSGLFKADLETMFANKLTFEEAIHDPKRDDFVRQRLSIASRKFYLAIEVGLAGEEDL